MIKLSFLVQYIVMVSCFIFSSASPFAQGGGFWQDPDDNFAGAHMDPAQRCTMCEAWRRTLLEHPRVSEKLKEQAKSINCSDPHCLPMCAIIIKKLIVSIIAQDRRLAEGSCYAASTEQEHI